MAKFEVKSCLGGISDYDDKGIRGAFKFASGIDIRKKTDSISCQQALVDEVCETEGGFTDLILWTIPASDGHVYGFGNSGKIYQRDSEDKTWAVKYAETGGRITGADEWFNAEDKAYLYWATKTHLHRKELPGESDWSDVDDGEDWPKSNLDEADWHTMKVAMGVLAICNGQYLAAVDFNDGYSNVVTNFLPGNIAKAIIEYNNRVLVGTVNAFNRQSGQLFIWEDPGDISEITSYAFKKQIPTKGINALVEGEYPLMQGGDKGGIFYSDLANVLPVVFTGNGQVNPDGVEIDEGLALFGMFGLEDSGIYTLGRKKKNGSFALNLDYPLSCDEIGSVGKAGNSILASYKINGDTPVYGLKRVDSENKAIGRYISLDLVAPKKFVNPVSWASIVFNASMPEGTKIECFYRVNKAGEWIQALMEGNEAEFIEGDEAVFLIGAEGRIFEFELVLTPNKNEAPEIYFPISVYFDA